MSEAISPVGETKWNLKLNLPQCEQYWNVFYKACFKSIVHNCYIWLQEITCVKQKYRPHPSVAYANKKKRLQDTRLKLLVNKLHV